MQALDSEMGAASHTMIPYAGLLAAILYGFVAVAMNFVNKWVNLKINGLLYVVAMEMNLVNKWVDFTSIQVNQRWPAVWLYAT